MNRSAFVALGFAGALALVAAPAAAQHQRGGEERHGNAAPRAESRRDGGSAPRAQSQQPAPRQEQRVAPRQEQRVAPSQEQRAVPRQEFHSAPQTYAPRYAPGYAAPHRGYAAPRYYSGRYYGPRYVGPAYAVAPRRFYRPYYVFHPRLSIGFGIWAGYPIPYYDPYYYPYDYYPYATAAPGYPPPPQGSVDVQPGQQNQPEQSNMGGLSFEITPNTAEVYVDGNYAGTVGQFTANSQPLGVPTGHHHVELREPGFNVSGFDVDVVAGQVIPFSGALER